jgi:chaperonin GroES
MALKIRPLHDRILVKQLEEESKTAGGIIIPDSAKEKPHQGKVMAVGKGKILEDGSVRPPDVKVGDKILFEKYAGSTLKMGGDEVMILREEEILAIIED